MKYMLKVTRYDEHPKAGQEMPRVGAYGGYSNVERYPDTAEVDVLLMAVDIEQFNAIRRAALEVSS